MHGGLDCGRGTEDDIVASMCQDMFTSCMGIIVLHWYHSPSMQLTTAMTAGPAPEPYSQACNLRREMLREQHVQSLWAAANRPASIEAAKQGRNQ